MNLTSLSLPFFTPTMARGFEQWRAKIMRNQNEWGDPISTIAISPLIGQSAGTEDGAQCSFCSSTPMNQRVQKSKAPNPILTSKGWTLEVLLGRGKRFQPAPRISALQDDLNDRISFYENSGIPFVVENLHHLPGWANDFVNIDWLENENSSKITSLFAFVRVSRHINFFHSFCQIFKHEILVPPVMCLFHFPNSSRNPEILLFIIRKEVNRPQYPQRKI